MYKAILFDLDNTLLDYDRCEADAMLLTGRRHGLEQSESFTWESFKKTYAEINWGYWSERVRRKLGIRDILDFSFRDTLLRLEQDAAPSGALADTYWEHFCALCHFEDGAHQLLNELHGRAKLGVISNGIGESQRRRTASGGIFHLFDAFIVSDEVGLWKPERAIFELALHELGVDRSEVLFVGDSLTDDYAGAQGASIDFCFYNRGGLPPEDGLVPHYTVERIGDVRRIVYGE